MKTCVKLRPQALAEFAASALTGFWKRPASCDTGQILQILIMTANNARFLCNSCSLFSLRA